MSIESAVLTQTGKTSKHGGDQPGATLPPEPAGLSDLQPAIAGGVVLAPEQTKRIAEARKRAEHNERRRIALELLMGAVVGGLDSSDVDHALSIADELIAKTGGHLAGTV